MLAEVGTMDETDTDESTSDENVSQDVHDADNDETNQQDSNDELRDTDAAESSADSNDDDKNDGEIDRLQKECHAMVQLLKRLERREHDLTIQNEILAREALMCGMDTSRLEAPQPKRRKSTKIDP
jgi:hypothetical protein